MDCLRPHLVPVPIRVDTLNAQLEDAELHYFLDVFKVTPVWLNVDDYCYRFNGYAMDYSISTDIDYLVCFDEQPINTRLSISNLNTLVGCTDDDDGQQWFGNLLIFKFTSTNNCLMDMLDADMTIATQCAML